MWLVYLFKEIKLLVSLPFFLFSPLFPSLFFLKFSARVPFNRRICTVHRWALMEILLGTRVKESSRSGTPTIALVDAPSPPPKTTTNLDKEVCFFSPLTFLFCPFADICKSQGDCQQCKENFNDGCGYCVTSYVPIKHTCPLSSCLK